MAQNNLIGLVTGFFSSKSSIDSVYQDNAKNVINANGLTGVERYLEIHKSRSSVSGVSKYLKKQEKTTVTSVSKYLIRQSITERSKKTASVSTGVEKYLNSRKEIAPIVRSGVAKYLDNIEKSSVSGVAKYLVKKNIADRNKPVHKKTRVSGYLENRKEHLTSGVARYLTRQTIAEKRANAEIVNVVTVLTGVEKYLQSHA